MASIQHTEMNTPLEKQYLSILDGDTTGSGEQDILNLFLFNSKECLQAMELSLEENQPYRWATAASELKNLSKIMGAKGIQSACEEAESKARSGASEKRAAMESLRTEVRKLREYVRNSPQ